MKKERLHKTASSLLLIIVLTAVMLLSAVSYTQDVLAMPDVEAGSSTGGSGRAASITYPFLDTAKVTYDWTFPYSDDYFRTDPAEFSSEFAKGSLGLAASAFRGKRSVVAPQYEVYLAEAGFTNLFAFGYDQPTTKDTLSGVIALKHVDDFTVIAVVTCGQGYGKEWAGNLKVGSGDVHQGFSKASKQLEMRIDKFIRDNRISGKKKLWLTGLSRAAAIANLTAADAIEGGKYEDVYAYLFGVPRTTKHPVAYEGIYNICGQFDPVANIPFESWGFGRHGTDLYTPAQESDDEYPYMRIEASQVAEELSGDHFRNNPEINYQLHLILEFMADFFPTNKDYAERFQDILIDAWTNGGVDNITGVMMASLGRLNDMDKKEAESVGIFLDYLSYAMGKHTRADVYGIDDGSWNPDEGLSSNVVIEHRPCTYVKWLFADLDDNSIYRSSIAYRRLIITGATDIDIYDDDKLAKTISRKGSVRTIDSSASDIFAVRSGNSTMICIPSDDEYVIRIKAPKKRISNTSISILTQGTSHPMTAQDTADP